MLVSIITASYNYENYISETIESVLNQTYSNWELIIVDDGSTDNSVELIKKYCSKDKRIKLYQHPEAKNKGLAETLKLGISKSNGEWIAFLESDDMWTKDYLESKNSVIKEYPMVNFIYNGINLFCDNAEYMSSLKSGYLKRIEKTVISMKYPASYIELLENENDINHIPTFSVVFLKKDLLTNLDFNSPIKPFLDFYIWSQILSRKECIVYYIDKKLTHWRIHPNSYASKKFSDNQFILFNFKRFAFVYKGFKLFSVKIRFILENHKKFRKCFFRIRFSPFKLYFLGKWFFGEE